MIPLLHSNVNVWINDNAKISSNSRKRGYIMCLIAGLIAQNELEKAILTAIHFQGELSQIKNNLIAEDFIDPIAKIFSRLKIIIDLKGIMLFFINCLAGVAELVDARFRFSDFCRVGSSPSARTKDTK